VNKRAEFSSGFIMNLSATEQIAGLDCSRLPLADVWRMKR
jgi:hypothetical protein